MKQNAEPGAWSSDPSSRTRVRTGLAGVTVKQGCTQQPCTFPLVCRFPRVTCVTRMRSASRLASPKVRCRGVVSLSWDARGRDPLRKQGGQARRARSRSTKLLKNKIKSKQQARLNRSRRADRDESPSRKCCAPRCMRI